MNLDLNEKSSYRPPVIKVSAGQNRDIDVLLEKILDHRAYLEESNELNEIRIRNNKLEILKMVEEDLMKLILDRAVKEDLIDNLARKVTLRETDPYTAKDEIIELITN
jgi:LAO/AO transport system kinase